MHRTLFSAEGAKGENCRNGEQASALCVRQSQEGDQGARTCSVDSIFYSLASLASQRFECLLAYRVSFSWHKHS